MADDVDATNDRIDAETALRVAFITRPRGPGRKICDDCGDDISPQRQELGAVLCYTCQDALERKNRHLIRP